MKTFILDTNVLLHDPACLKVFGNNEVTIPLSVLDELDNIKKRIDEMGRNARAAIRVLDDLRIQGSLSEGVKVEESFIRVELNHRHHIPDGLSSDKVDNRLISAALGLQKEGKNVIVVSKDINLRVKCDALGIKTEDYVKDKLAKQPESVYSGVKIINVPSQIIDNLYTNKQIELENLQGYINQFFILKSDTNNSHSAIARYIGDNKLVLCKEYGTLWDIVPRNVEQKMAADLLLNPKIKLVTLIGKAGSGKTLLASAAALRSVLDKQNNTHQRILISRPIQPMGRDIGFLPGDIEEKLNPWMQPIYDNLELLLGTQYTMLNMYKDEGLIQVEPLTYIRGRSIPNSFIILDECFPYDQCVVLENNKKMKIGNLYKMFQKNVKLPKVKSFNENKQFFENCNILNIWKRPPAKLIELSFANRKIRCTYNHKFLTPNGWEAAQNLKLGDFVLTTEPNSNQLKCLNDDQYQVLLGSFLGNGSISKIGLHQYKIKISHSIKRNNYCNWKAKIFKRNVKIIKNSGENLISFSTLAFGLANNFPKNKQTCPQWILNDLDARGLAIWFMDNGFVNKAQNFALLNTCSFDKDSQVRMVEKLQSMGIDCSFEWYRKDGYYIIFNKKGLDNLLKIIDPYVCEEMSYNVGRCKEQYIWNNKYKTYGLTVLDKITYLKEKEEVYDMEVEKNHNFTVCSSSRGKFKNCSGIIVHNCQNLTAQEIKTIITRLGENSKIVITGDIEQIDNPYIDFADNGLTHVVERFKNFSIAGHITLRKGERSKLATLASEIL